MKKAIAGLTTLGLLGVGWYYVSKYMVRVMEEVSDPFYN